MNTMQLECFIAVAENLNYAKAAEEVHMSQPAVTKKIQSLEEELEIRLLERDTRHVSLTYAGKQFYASAKSILLQEKNAMAGIASLKAEAKRSLAIGSHNKEVYSYMGKVLANVYLKTQDIRPDIVEAPFQALNLSLEAMSVDIVIGTYEIMRQAGMSDNAFHALAPSPMYCLTSINNHNDNYPYSISMKELTPEFMQKRLFMPQRLTCYDLEQYYLSDKEWQKVIPRFSKNTLFCDNLEAAICMAEAGFGILFMPEPEILQAPDRFCRIPITDAVPLSYGYFYNKRNENPVLEILRQSLEDYFNQQ